MVGSKRILFLYWTFLLPIALAKGERYAQRRDWLTRLELGRAGSSLSAPPTCQRIFLPSVVLPVRRWRRLLASTIDPLRASHLGPLGVDARAPDEDDGFPLSFHLPPALVFRPSLTCFDCSAASLAVERYAVSLNDRYIAGLLVADESADCFPDWSQSCYQASLLHRTVMGRR